MTINKRSTLLITLILFTRIVCAQSNSLNVGITLLGLKDNNPYGGGVHLGYEYHIPKLNFLAVEARLNAGKLLGDGLYQVNPIKEWNYSADYFMAGIIPRFYYCLSDDLYLFLDTEIGVARLKGKTFFSEERNWKATKSFNYNYYAIKVGIIAPINEKLKISLALGYMSIDIADLMNSNLSTASYHFKKQTIDFGTSFSLHVIL